VTSSEPELTTGAPEKDGDSMDLLHNLIPWGVEVIVWLQSFSTPALDILFALITGLGEAHVALIVAAVVIWYLGGKTGMGFVFLLLLALGVNQGLKVALAIERPFVHHPEVRVKILYTGFSFPSGHAQLASVMWGTAALRVKRTWFTWISVVIIGLVSLSRVYLGVHYPQDVLAGILLGLVGIFVLGPMAENLARWLTTGSLPVQLTGIMLPAAFILLVSHHEYAHALAGLILGLSAGHVLSGRLVRCRFDPEPRRCVARGLVGLSVCTVVFAATSLAWRVSDPFFLASALRVARYGLLGATCTLAVPWLCCTLGLATREYQPSPE